MSSGQQQDQQQQQQQQQQEKKWPPDLYKWVQRIFKRIPKGSPLRDTITQSISEIINDVKKSRQLWTLDWNSYQNDQIEDLLQQATDISLGIYANGVNRKRKHQDKAAQQSKSQSESTVPAQSPIQFVRESPQSSQLQFQQASQSSSQPRRNGSSSQAAQQISTSVPQHVGGNKAAVAHSSLSQEPPRIAPQKRKQTSLTQLNGNDQQQQQQQQQQQKKIKQFKHIDHTAESEFNSPQKLQQRRNRFIADSGNGMNTGNNTPRTLSPLSFSIDVHGEAHHDNINCRIVGTNQSLEKQYLRLTQAPDPSTVRPKKILIRALLKIKNRWKQSLNGDKTEDELKEAYLWVNDQLKSIRQDMTVQMIREEFTIQVYETHARIALQVNDLGEFNQCQSQLNVMYRLIDDYGHREEFAAYRLLYFLLTQNKGAVNQFLQNLETCSQSFVSSEEVTHALSVRSCLALGDFCHLFKLYASCPNLGRFLMKGIVERERVRCMAVTSKALRPSLDIQWLTELLGFDTRDDLIQFLNQFGIEPEADTNALDAKQVQAQFNQAMQKYMKVDIKGQL
ncbi:hypothetical protein MP228_003273 [Amoeboaphelidium protococcarum]|nr:hypothetical protein MP228_003273 [Amoeboaphelidium protococcarum]